MMRIVRRTAAALGVVTGLALPSAALADGGHGWWWHRPPDLMCQTTSSNPYFSGTYDNVTVPTGQTCNLSNSTVEGGVTVQGTGTLSLTGTGTVARDLFVGSQGSAFEGSDWVIHGAAVGDGAGTLTITGTVHGVFARDTGTLGVQSATVDGDIVSDGGVFGGSITSNVIRGSVVIAGTTGYQGSSGTWFISGPQLNGSPQQIGGSLLLIGNQAAIYNVDNAIGRNLVCLRNTPAPTSEEDSVGRRSVGQCADVGSGPVAQPAPSSSPSSPPPGSAS